MADQRSSQQVMIAATWVETANPNAWSGATEHLNSSDADFMAIQETKVEGDAVDDAENLARSLGWSASVSPWLHGAGGGQPAGSLPRGARSSVGLYTRAIYML